MPRGRPSTAISPASRMENLKTALEAQRGNMQMLAAKGASHPTKLMKLVLSAAVKQPKLLECDTKSVVMAALKAAELGLDPSGTLGSAYLVPFFDRKVGKYTAQLIVGYQGLIDLARRSGAVLDVSSNIVYEADQYDFQLGTDPHLIHRPSLAGNRGEPIFAYAVAHIRDARPHIEVMSVDEIERVRNSSQAGQAGPWRDHWTEMARKTVLRRLLKYVPKSTDLADAIAAEEDVEVGHIVAIDDPTIEVKGEEVVEAVVEPEDAPEPPKGADEEAPKSKKPEPENVRTQTSELEEALLAEEEEENVT